MRNRDDGPDPGARPLVCWVTYRQYTNAFWSDPRHWAVAPMVAETEKTWVRLQQGGSTIRQSKDLIVGRYTCREHAEAYRAKAVAIKEDVDARCAAVKAEMNEAIRPFKDRLTQLAAELADRLAEETKP